MKKKHRIFCGLIGVGISAASTCALAADSLAPDLEIVVTAMKRSESLQKIPGSISAIGGEDLEQRGVTDFSSLVAQVPGLTYGEIDGATFVTIRGVGASVDNGIAEPSVATYVDGIFLSRSTMGNLDLQDLQRIEVLRGPQGTLYGRNATGGAVNFISRRPSAVFEGGATLGYGNFNDRLASAYLTGPISETLRVRVSGGAEKRDGYIKNIIGGQSIANVDRWQVRGALAFEPTPEFTIDLSAQYQEDDSRSAYQQQLTSPTSPLVPAGTISTNRPWRVAAESPYAQHKTTLILAGTVNWQLNDAISVKSVTGYVDHHIDSTLDGDATSFGLVNIASFIRPTKTFTQELNLIGETGDLKWLVGAYYFDENFLAYEPIPLPNGVPGAAPPGTTSLQRLAEKTRAFAVFADATYSITDTLRINAGLRWNTEKKRFLQTVGSEIPGVGFFGDTDIASRSKESKLLPKIGLQLDVSPTTNVYAQYQIGQKSGGMNIATIRAPFGSERLTAYEAGVKSRLFDNLVTLNLSGFYYEYSGLQVSKVVGGTTSAVENADAEIYGVELETAARLGKWRANLGATALKSRYTEFESIDSYDPAAGLQDLRGNRLTRAPDYSINAGLEWSTPLQFSDESDLTLRAEVYHSGPYALAAFARQPDEPQDPYTLLNVAATLRLNKNVQVRVHAENLTNKAYLSSKLYSPLQGSFLGAYGPPRFYGAEVKLSF